MSISIPIRLGVNVDHVATVRNARGGRHPDPLHDQLRRRFLIGLQFHDGHAF